MGPAGPKGELGFPGRPVSATNPPYVHRRSNPTTLLCFRAGSTRPDGTEGREGGLRRPAGQPSSFVSARGREREPNCERFSAAFFCLGTSRTTGAPRNVQLPQRSKRSLTSTHTHTLFPSGQLHLSVYVLTSPPLPSEDGVSHPSQASLQNGRKVPSVPTIKTRLSTRVHVCVVVKTLTENQT